MCRCDEEKKMVGVCFFHRKTKHASDSWLAQGKENDGQHTKRMMRHGIISAFVYGVKVGVALST
jgi:hypothetical protein